MPVLDLHHVAIKSKNLKATEKFYTKVLGMKKVPRAEFPFPGVWLQMGETMFHIYGGSAAKTHAGNFKYSPKDSPIDHIALSAKGFDKMKENFKKQRCTWRQNDVRDFKIWQLFLEDPSGVIIELNFDTTKEPRGSKGPNGRNQFNPGRPFK